MSELILHHYDASPFADDRLARLGFAVVGAST